MCTYCGRELSSNVSLLLCSSDRTRHSSTTSPHLCCLETATASWPVVCEWCSMLCNSISIASRSCQSLHWSSKHWIHLALFVYLWKWNWNRTCYEVGKLLAYMFVTTSFTSFSVRNFAHGSSEHTSNTAGVSFAPIMLTVYLIVITIPV